MQGFIGPLGINTDGFEANQSKIKVSFGIPD